MAAVPESFKKKQERDARLAAAAATAAEKAAQVFF
jgi:hypothetical protein